MVLASFRLLLPPQHLELFQLPEVMGAHLIVLGIDYPDKSSSSVCSSEAAWAKHTGTGITFHPCQGARPSAREWLPYLLHLLTSPGTSRDQES